MADEEKQAAKRATKPTAKPKETAVPQAGPVVDAEIVEASVVDAPEAGETTVEAVTAPKKVPAKKVVKVKAEAAQISDSPLVVALFDGEGKSKGTVDLPVGIFGVEPHMAVMHQAMIRQLANARQGTASTKKRGEVSGGGAKPHRQKGTGRARHGSSREPSMVGGGVVFGPQPRSFALQMPRKMRRLAIRSA
jgi:hypothetical protein